MNYKYWLATAVVLVIVEILPPPTNFFFLCLALGAVGASIAACFSTITWLPWVVFSVVSIASIPLLIPLARFLFTPKHTPSNVDEVLNQDGVVIETVDEKIAGTVKVRGELWRAYSEDGAHAKDEHVRVVRIDGTHVFVRRIS